MLPFSFVKYSHFTQMMCYYLNNQFHGQMVKGLTDWQKKLVSDGQTELVTKKKKCKFTIPTNDSAQ